TMNKFLHRTIQLLVCLTSGVHCGGNSDASDEVSPATESKTDSGAAGTSAFDESADDYHQTDDGITTRENAETDGGSPAGYELDKEADDGGLGPDAAESSTGG